MQDAPGFGGNGTRGFGVLAVVIPFCMPRSASRCEDDRRLFPSLVRVILDATEVRLSSQGRSPPGWSLSSIRVQSRIVEVWPRLLEWWWSISWLRAGNKRRWRRRQWTREQWRRAVQHPNNREEALGLVATRHSSISILWRTRWMLGTTRLPCSPLIGIP